MMAEASRLNQNMTSIPAQPFKDKEFCLAYYRDMVRTRLLEERMIGLVKKGEGFFWIGGPGEEAFSTALGRQVNKGHGLDYDFLHLHYRSNGVLLSMGEDSINFFRQMLSRSTDPYSGGRNFASHFAKKEWNVAPVTSTIGTQFSVAPGSARAQMKHKISTGHSGITIVVGGDAGTAEGDFATCLVWATRPKEELPLLMIVTNNSWGISTALSTQHGEKNIADRGKSFQMKTAVVDGNNPEKVWSAIAEAMEYIRSTGKPFLLEAKVSRLNGHSSSSGANRVEGEACPIEIFGAKMIKKKWTTQDELDAIWKEIDDVYKAEIAQARTEPKPDPSTVKDFTFAGNEGGVV